MKRLTEMNFDETSFFGSAVLIKLNYEEQRRDWDPRRVHSKGLQLMESLTKN